jgi:uncharacterized protein YndB with AHSA1/START domain
LNEEIEDTWKFTGIYDEPGRIKGHCVGHRITIEAPPELVWDFVADFEGWKSWNPLYSHTSGLAEEGETLRFCVNLAGRKPQKGKAQVHTVRQNELLEYGLSNLAGLVKVFRFIEVEELSPVRCRVINGEITGGPLRGPVSRARGERAAQGLRVMNVALKKVAERKWRGRPG